MDSLSQVLKKILSLNPDLGKGIHEARILELWAKAMGEPISKHAKAVQMKGAILFISVDQPVWRQELHSNKMLALKKLNTLLTSELGKPESRDFWVEDVFFLGSQASPSTRSKGDKPFRKK